MTPTLYPFSIVRNQDQKAGEIPSLKDFGAVGDLQVFESGCSLAVTSGSPNVTSNFSPCSGTITSTGSTVIGLGTSFLTQCSILQYITAGGQTLLITDIQDDTHLTVGPSFSPDVSGSSFTSGVGFNSIDIGKRIVIYGAGGSGTPQWIGESRGSVTSSNAYQVVATIDSQGGTSVKFGGNCVTNGITWEVWGDNNSNFSTEVLLSGPTAITPLAASTQYIETPPTKRYYRVKMISTVSGQFGLGYVSILVLGYVLGTTITGVVTSTQATISTNALTTKVACYAYFGTDDTIAIQQALNVSTSVGNPNSANRGIVVTVPRGKYLFSSPIFQPKCVTVKGIHGGGSIFYADGASFTPSTPMWNMTGTFATDGLISFFSRLEDVRIDCGHVPGSIGVLCDALQENSGLYRTTVIQWTKTGVQVGGVSDRYGSSNWIIQDPWIYPSMAAWFDDTVVGVSLDYSLDTFCIRGTVLGQGGYLCGYGKSVEIDNGNIRWYKLHTESARIGVHFMAGAGGIIDGLSTQSFVSNGVMIDAGGTPISIRNLQTLGNVAIQDNISGTTVTDNYVSNYNAVALPDRTRGGNNSSDLEQWIPVSFAGVVGNPGFRIDTHGTALTDGGAKKYPNVVGLVPLNFGGAFQGGFIATNASMGAYPNWIPTSGWTFNLLGDGFTLILVDQDGIAGHTFVNGDTCNVGALGTLPTGLTSQTTYYVINSNPTVGTLRLSATLSGPPIGVSGGSGGPFYISGSLMAGWLRLGASGAEFRYGWVPNTQGSNPGIEVVGINTDGAGDSLQGGVFPKRLFFQTASGVGTLLLGDSSAVNWAAWYHGDAANKTLKIQRSTNSGVSWADALSIDLQTGKVTIAELGGGGTQIVSTDNNGTLGVSSIPSSPIARSFAYNSSPQSIANITTTALTFDTNFYDNGPVHSTSVNPTRFTAPVTGYYLCVGQVNFAASGTNTFGFIEITVNGSVSYNAQQTSAGVVSSSTDVTLQTSAVLFLNAGDYVEFYVEQNSGASLNAQSGKNTTTGSMIQIQ